MVKLEYSTVKCKVGNGMSEYLDSGFDFVTLHILGIAPCSVLLSAGWDFDLLPTIKSPMNICDLKGCLKYFAYNDQTSGRSAPLTYQTGFPYHPSVLPSSFLCL